MKALILARLDAAKKFIRGASTVLEIWPPARRRYHRTDLSASEMEALRGDWEKIGGDLRHAMREASAFQGATSERFH